MKSDDCRSGYQRHHSCFRKNPAALQWFSAQQAIFSITPICWLEVMNGVSNKRAQTDTLQLLSGFEILYLTPTDMDWAMEQILTFRFSRGVGVMDCLIASVCQRLQLPVYTDNVKDYLKILPANLVVKPY